MFSSTVFLWHSCQRLRDECASKQIKTPVELCKRQLSFPFICIFFFFFGSTCYLLGYMSYSIGVWGWRRESTRTSYKRTLISKRVVNNKSIWSLQALFWKGHLLQSSHGASRERHSGDKPTLAWHTVLPNTTWLFQGRRENQICCNCIRMLK